MNADSESPVPRISPLERFVFPVGVDGSQGSNRLERKWKTIDADNDLDAINAWLLSMTDEKNGTVLLYRYAAEKLLNWACFCRGKALASLDADDLRAFAEFLAAPSPSSIWISRQPAARNSPGWRPFRGPLSEASVRTVLAANSALFRWLRKTGYANMPFIGERGNAGSSNVVSRSSAVTPRVGAHGILSQASWEWVKESLIADSDLPTRLAIELLYFANLKLVEIAELHLSDCIAPSKECVAWRLQVDSMTNSMRCVYALPPLGRSLSRWHKNLAMSPQTSLSPREVREKSAVLFDRSVNLVRSVKKILRLARKRAEAGGDLDCAQELRTASPICFRSALEKHAGPDGAFIMGFIANAQGCRSLIALYARATDLTNEDIESGWTRLAKHWMPYDAQVSKSLKAGLID